MSYTRRKDVTEKAFNDASGKTTPVDADKVGLIDSADLNILKSLTWANMKATLKLKKRTATATNYSTVVTDDIVGVTDTSAARTITLDTDTVTDGRIVHIKDESGGAETHNITIATEGSETIDGVNTFAIDANYGAVSLYCDGTNWFIF